MIQSAAVAAPHFPPYDMLVLIHAHANVAAEEGSRFTKVLIPRGGLNDQAKSAVETC